MKDSSADKSSQIFGLKPFKLKKPIAGKRERAAFTRSAQPGVSGDTPVRDSPTQKAVLVWKSALAPDGRHGPLSRPNT